MADGRRSQWMPPYHMVHMQWRVGGSPSHAAPGSPRARQCAATAQSPSAKRCSAAAGGGEMKRKDERTMALLGGEFVWQSLSAWATRAAAVRTTHMRCSSGEAPGHRPSATSNVIGLPISVAPLNATLTVPVPARASAPIATSTRARPSVLQAIVTATSLGPPPSAAKAAASSKRASTAARSGASRPQRS